MKRLFLAAMLALACRSASAFSLRLLDGTVIREASILNTSRSDLNVSGFLPDGSWTVRTVRYGDLTPYSLGLIRGMNLIPGNPGLQPGMDWPRSSVSSLPYLLPGTIGTIRLHCVAELNSGSIGWASSYIPGSVGAAQHFGMIFVYGAYLTQGNVWFGHVYPTGRTITYNGQSYACYAVSSGLANQIRTSWQE